MNAMTTKTTERKNEQLNDEQRRRARRSFEWIPEVLALVIVTPALIHGIASLQNLPIV